jgi:HSP20 family protein
MWPDNFNREMRRMRRRMNNLFSGVDEPFEDEEYEDYRKAWADFREGDEEYLIAIELPGIDKGDIELNVDGNLLTIKASKNKEDKKEEEGNYSYSRSYSGFVRSVTLPESAETEKIKAEFKNGVLKVKIPKRKVEKKKGKKIKID